MTTSSNLKNQKMHKTNIKKQRKQRKKELANRKDKKQQQVAQQTEQKILADYAPICAKCGRKMVSGDAGYYCENKDCSEYDQEMPAFEPEEMVFTPEEPKPISPARRAFQDV